MSQPLSVPQSVHRLDVDRMISLTDIHGPQKMNQNASGIFSSVPSVPSIKIQNNISDLLEIATHASTVMVNMLADI